MAVPVASSLLGLDREEAPVLCLSICYRRKMYPLDYRNVFLCNSLRLHGRNQPTDSSEEPFSIQGKVIELNDAGEYGLVVTDIEVLKFEK